MNLKIFRFDKDMIDKNEYAFNHLHGGLNINVTNVIFTQGENDPFRGLGIQNEPNEFSPLFIIPGNKEQLISVISEMGIVFQNYCFLKFYFFFIFMCRCCICS